MLGERKVNEKDEAIRKAEKEDQKIHTLIDRLT